MTAARHIDLCFASVPFYWYEGHTLSSLNGSPRNFHTKFAWVTGRRSTFQNFNFRPPKIFRLSRAPTNLGSSHSGNHLLFLWIFFAASLSIITPIELLKVTAKKVGIRNCLKAQHVKFCSCMMLRHDFFRWRQVGLWMALNWLNGMTRFLMYLLLKTSKVIATT